MSNRNSPVRVVLFLLAGFAFALSGCKKNKPLNFGAELPPGQLALRKIPPSQYPDFSGSTWNLGVVRQSIDASLVYMSKPSSKAFFPYLDISPARDCCTHTRCAPRTPPP